MNTQFALSPDNKRITYDRSGTGPAVVLVHGGGGNRMNWHEAGYVERLHNEFTVITLDLRGHGESDKPFDASEYSTTKMTGDILAVVDACGIQDFTIWGMSFGGKVSRYLAVQSERVSKFIMMGTPMGPGATPEIRQEVEAFCVHWPPILKAQKDGNLDLDSLSEADRETLAILNIPVTMAWAKAMLDWREVQPADFRPPTLWLVGSDDPPAMASVLAYQHELRGTNVRLEILDGLNHDQVFEQIDEAFPVMLEFTRSR